MFDWITGVIAQLGYLGVLALTFLENLFPPIPSELVIPLAGFVAAQGKLDLYIVIGIAALGSLSGSTVWYAIGRRVGERRLHTWIERHGRWLTVSTEDLERSKNWFKKHGRAAVFLGRLMPGVRTFVSLPAGFSKMPAIPFLLYSALGTLIWTTALALAGKLLQSNFTRVGDYMNVATNILLAVGLVLLIRRYIRCWNSTSTKTTKTKKKLARATCLFLLVAPVAGCSAPAGAPPAAPVADRWLGEWRGPEGTMLSIESGGGSYAITVRNLDGPRRFQGVAVPDGLQFERDGVSETIRATGGDATGMKWLRDKSNCLTVRAGEGYCRD